LGGLVAGDEDRERNHDRQRQQPAEDERGAFPHAALGREDEDERGERKRFERDHQADENKVQDDHARPSLLAAAAARSAFAAGKSRCGQRVTSVAGDLRREPMPGLPPAGALLIERPGPCGAC
jgi:hypothetical protein